MHKLFLISGSVFGALGVAFGAFGAHALKAQLNAIGRLETYETAVKYQFYHALVLLIIGIFMAKNPSTLLTWSGYSFILGTLVFSGSLYILCLTNVSRWGAITPLGGLMLIAGWVLLGVAFAKKSSWF